MEVPDLTASTTGGPIYGDLNAGMFWRDAGASVLRSGETFADVGQVVFIGWQRADFQVRDAAIDISCFSLWLGQGSPARIGG